MNEFAVTAADVGDGLTNCASALSVAGNSVQEAAAMVVGITEVTQDASKAGNALRTLSLRLHGTTAEELESIGEDTEGLIEVTSTLQDTIKGITGVDIVDAEGELRSTYDVMADLADVFSDLSTNEQSYVLETIAGKNRASDVAALLNNWDQVEAAMQAATDAEGSAAEEYEVHLDTIEAKLASLESAWIALSNDVMDSELIKSGIEFLTNVVQVIDTIVDTFGSLGTAIGAITIGATIKSIT